MAVGIEEVDGQCVGITVIPDHGEKATVGVGKDLLALLLREFLLEPAHRPKSHFFVHTILSPIMDAINVNRGLPL